MAITMRFVITPPNTTAGAVATLSKAPISLEEPTNIEFAEDMRTRILSGVRSCRIAWRITTLTPSAIPLKKSASSEIQNTVEGPNTMIKVAMNNPELIDRKSSTHFIMRDLFFRRSS